jgi:DNA-binding beta-propeller fold protein YncE
VLHRRRGIEIRVLWAIAGVLLIAAVAMVGCGGGVVGEGNPGGGERGSAATDGETTALEGGRPASGTAVEPAGLDVEVVAPGGAYVPVGYSEGSLWATEPSTCNDTMSASGSASSSAGASLPSTMMMGSSAQAMCGLSDKMVLKRLEPRTGEETAAVTLKDFATNTTEVAVRAGSVWVSSTSGEAGAVLKVDLGTNRVVDRIPVGSPTGVAFGQGSVWVTSSGTGKLSRVDPRTGEVAARIEVGRGATDVAVDEGSGAVWVASGGFFLGEGSEHNKLSRVDAATDRVVAEIPIAAHEPEGGAFRVAVGEGAVWAQGVSGGLFKVDPETNEVVAERDLGDYSSDLAVHGGSVWATAQVSVGTRLYRVDPRTARVVAFEHGPDPSEGGYGELVAGGGYVWFASGGGLARVAP